MKQAATSFLFLLLLSFLLPDHAAAQYQFEYTYHFPNGEKSTRVTERGGEISTAQTVMHFDSKQVPWDSYKTDTSYRDSQERLVVDELTLDGQVHTRQVYAGDTFLSVFSFHDRTGIVRYSGNYRKTDKLDFDSLTFKDPKMWRYENAEYQSGWIRVGEWKTFHPNGALESIGRFLPQEVALYRIWDQDSREVMDLPPSRGDSIDHKAFIRRYLTYLRDGSWTYYDPEGNVVRRESYSQGQLQFEQDLHQAAGDERQHMIQYYDNGQKQVEMTECNGVPCETTTSWDREGNRLSEQVYSEYGYAEIGYYAENGQVAHRGHYDLRAAPPSATTVVDSANFDIYEPSDCPYPCYVRSGVWRYYHPNGALESEGRYLPHRYETALPMDVDETGLMVIIPKTSFDDMGPAGGVLVSNYLKDGTWTYYDDQGQLLKTEDYRGGILQGTY